MTIETLPGGDFRRTFAYDRGRSGADWFAYSVERCTPGTVPPAADACIAARYPPTTLEVAPDMGWGLGPNAPNGTVRVLVSLDEASRVTRVRVVSSTAPELNIAAMERTKRSRFRTAIVNCKPIAADYIFTVDF
ncbi:MAG TPA: energy transducer TonB [Candidatus Elarobacter sp.]|nr:energy transducer TonB [Dongiaceae bacterium]HZW52377.1 energy transducer TonB [Candidatus Elarobacter sp.]